MRDEKENLEEELRFRDLSLVVRMELLWKVHQQEEEDVERD